MSNIVKLIRNCFSTPNLAAGVERFPTLEDKELANIEKRIQDLIDTVAHMSRELKLDHLTEAILGLRKLMLQVRRMRNGSSEITREKIDSVLISLNRYRLVVVHCHLVMYESEMSECPILEQKVQELQSTTWMKLSQANYRFTNEETETAEQDALYVKNYVQSRKPSLKAVKAMDEGEKSLALLQQLAMLIKALENGYHVPPTLGRPRECCFNDVKTLRRQFHKLQKISRRGPNSESLEDIEKIISVIGHHVNPNHSRNFLDTFDHRSPRSLPVGEINFDESLI